MSKHKIKRIVSLVSVIGLSACNGGTSSDNNVSPQPQPKPPSPSSNEIKVPLSMQVGTPVSIHSKENSGTKSLQSLKSLTVNNECLELVTNADDGKNYKTEVNSSQYWSTAKITFSIKNKCNSPTALSNVAVLVNGFNINGNKVTSLGDVSQTGSPYMAIKTSGDSVIINTPECNDEHCNWAKLPAGAEHKFTISSSVSAPISSVGVQSVSFDEIPPSPTPTPDPQPVDKTGEFSLHIDASSLKDICGKQACTAEINIGVPSGQSGIDKISFNPAESTIIDRVYSNLLPGNYTLQVNNGNLPKDTTFDYGNGSGTVSIAAGSKAKAQINFKHSDVVAPADVTFAIGGISDLAKFTAISSVEADVTSETTGKVYKLSLPLGSGISLNGIPVNDTYTIKTQSIANPEEGIFYKGVNLSGVKFNAGVNSKTLTFTKVITAPKVITFNVNGLENGNQLSVLLADSGTIDPGFYIYTPAKSVVNGSKLKFVDGTVAININNAPTGYTLNSDYQKVVNDSATINLTLTKDNVTPVVTDKINATYWALWGDNTSYPIGGVPHPSVPVDAQDIDKSVNLIIASFIVTDANGDYVLAYKDPGKEGPSYYTDDQLLSMIKKVKEQKRKMIISLGGEKFHLHMKTPEDKQRFVTQTEKIIDKFGFDGIDLDLEAGAVSEDPNLLASAVLEIANKYRVKGQDFLITMAPEWGYITPYRYGCGDWGSGSYQNSFYIDLVKALGMNNISYIMPQTYNQGPANGVCGPDKTKVVPADGTDKFIAAMAWAISNPTGYNLSITGVSGSKMPLIPANKLVMGIPATVGAAGGEMAYVLTPTQIKSSYKLAVSYGAPFAGYFTWAADWDNTPYSNSALGFTHAKWDSAKAIYEAITGTTPPAPTPDPTDRKSVV